MHYREHRLLRSQTDATDALIRTSERTGMDAFIDFQGQSPAHRGWR
jgi:hypothetical protein